MSRKASPRPVQALVDCQPAVAYANHYSFSRGERVGPNAAASRFFLVVLSGKGTFTIQGRRYEATPERLWFLPWGAPILYHADGSDPFTLAGCHFWPHCPGTLPATHSVPHKREADEEILEHPAHYDIPELRGMPLEIPRATLPQAPLLVERMIDEFQRRDPWMPYLLSAYAKAFLIELVRGVASASASDHPRAADIRRVRECLDRHPLDRRSREEWARLARMSPSHFASIFREVTGLSPNQYRLRAALNLARQLLRTSSLGLKEIAAQTGFSDPFYLSRAFKKAFGVSPDAYRRERKMI